MPDEMTSYGSYETDGVSVDGRPLIEVHDLTRVDTRTALTGTASVYEATLLVHVLSPDGHRRVIPVTATAGGPERGDWSIEFDAESGSLVMIGQQEPEEARGTAPTRQILIRLDDL